MKSIGLFSSLPVIMFQCWLDIVMTTSSSTTLSSSLLCESLSFMLLVLSFLSGFAGNDRTSTPQRRCKSLRLCQCTHIHLSESPSSPSFPSQDRFHPGNDGRVLVGRRGSGPMQGFWNACEGQVSWQSPHWPLTQISIYQFNLFPGRSPALHRSISSHCNFIRLLFTPPPPYVSPPIHHHGY